MGGDSLLILCSPSHVFRMPRWPLDIAFTSKRIMYGMHPLAESCVTFIMQIEHAQSGDAEGEAALMNHDLPYIIRYLQLFIDVGKINLRFRCYISVADIQYKHANVASSLGLIGGTRPMQPMQQ